MTDPHDSENREAALVWANHLTDPRVKLEHYGTIRGDGNELRSTVDGHLVAKAEVEDGKIKRMIINKNSPHLDAAKQAASNADAIFEGYF